MIVTVKRNHFSESKGYENGFSCPLYLALVEMFPDAYVSVGGTTATINGVVWWIPDYWTIFFVNQRCELSKTEEVEEQLILIKKS